MAEEKVTFSKTLKQLFSQKGRVRSYILFTLILMTFAFVTTYLNYTDFSIIGIFIFIIILLPLVVTFTEYSALIESGNEPPRQVKVYYNLFKNTYRSGRFNVFFSWKTLLFYFLYTIIVSFLFLGGLYAFIYFNDKPFLASLMDIVSRFQSATSPEMYATLGDELLALFAKYNGTINIFNQLALIFGLIFIFNRGVFNVYLSIFIEHRPTYRFKDISQKFIGENKDKQRLFLMQLFLTFFSFLFYTLLYIGSYFLLNFLAPSPMLFLQVELIALLSFGVILPFTTRFYFYYYHAFMEPKRIDILKFTIVELKEILNNPTLPPEANNYIHQILMMREEELKARQAFNNEEEVTKKENETALNEDEQKPSPDTE